MNYESYEELRRVTQVSISHASYDSVQNHARVLKSNSDYFGPADTRLCDNESNLKVVQSVMGHSDIQTTMDIYAECTQEKKDEVFANLNGKSMLK